MGRNNPQRTSETGKTAKKRARAGESEQDREDNGRALEPEPRKV